MHSTEGRSLGRGKGVGLWLTRTFKLYEYTYVWANAFGSVCVRE